MMLEYKHFVISERVVSRCYYFFTGLKSFEYLIVLWVLSSDAYLASRCLAAIWRDDENPFAAGLLVECASWDKHCVLSLSELEVQIVSLPAAYVVGCLTIEFEVGLELAVAHFGIYLANDCAV